jgi:CheY-like chemotaxis protein
MSVRGEEAGPRHEPSAPAPRCDVLVVDDDPDIADTIAAVIGARGYQVETAADGARALDRMRRPPRPALVLLDLMMPVMDGGQLRRAQLAEPELAGIPVVVLTADTRAAAQPSMFPDGYLLKPVDLERLLGTVRRYCR